MCGNWWRLSTSRNRRKRKKFVVESKFFVALKRVFLDLYTRSSSNSDYRISWSLSVIYQCSCLAFNLFYIQVILWIMIRKWIRHSFCLFRSLYCSRTKIHINLLLAIFIQIIARIVNYGWVHQWISVRVFFSQIYIWIIFLEFKWLKPMVLRQHWK